MILKYIATKIPATTYLKHEQRWNIIIIIIIIIIIKIYRAPKTINTLRRYLQQLECIVMICKII